MHCRDKKVCFSVALLMCLLGLWVASCAVENRTPVTLTTQIKVSPSATINPTMTPLPKKTFTPSSISIVLPSVILSPQEAEDALQELLKTNGYCTGKCLVGIRPDEMTVQEAVDQMARWGMLSIDENNDGRTFIHGVPPTPNDKQIRINLVLILRQKAIEGVSFYIPRRMDGAEFVDADVWLANREAWQAFQFDNLLKVYGTPSFVGFRFATTQREGNPIVYTLDVHYEKLNLEIGIGGLAYGDGHDVFICPSKDPHSLGIDINPNPSLTERQQASPITWQALTSNDLQAFFETFTDERNPYACVTTTLNKILELDPFFR